MKTIPRSQPTGKGEVALSPGDGKASPDAFNPYGLHSIHIPLGLLVYPNLSSGAKLLYGRLALFRGRRADGYCNPELPTLAESMNASIATIDRWLKELIAEGFIARVRRRRGNAENFFLPHPCLTNSGDGKAPSQSQTEEQDSSDLGNQESVLYSSELRSQGGLDSANLLPRLRRSCVLDSADLLPPYKEENIHFENIHEDIQSSSVVSSSQNAAAAEESDDDRNLNLKTQNQDGPDEIQQIINFLLVARGTSTWDFEKLKFGSSIFGEPTVNLTGLRPIDREGAVKIRSYFHSTQEFEAWVNDTIERGLQGKARTASWGLWLKDAEQQAPYIRDRLIAEKREAEEKAAAAERVRLAEAEQQKLREVPRVPAEAIALVRREGRDVPAVLQQRLTRLGMPISVDGLHSACKSWRKCQGCRDGGLQGRVLAKTLAFCACPAGEEHRYAQPDYPAQEIARVHASPQNLMVAAAHECGMPFMADALEKSPVIDDGSAITISLSREYSLSITQRDAETVVEHLGLTRSVAIHGSALPR